MRKQEVELKGNRGLGVVNLKPEKAEFFTITGSPATADAKSHFTVISASVNHLLTRDI